MKRLMYSALLALLALVVPSTPTPTPTAWADQEAFVARLTGFQETPSISTRARGRFEARIAHDRIDFELRYEDLEAPVTVAHIHFAQRHVAGGISVFFCGGGSKPAWPQSGTVTGRIVASDVIGPENQGIAPGELRELIRAIRAGATYANVHSVQFPAGEIRGQILPAESHPETDDAGE